jgi:acetyltransferase
MKPAAQPGARHGRAWSVATDMPARGDERLRLADGRCARLRPVRPDDVAVEQAFVGALSPQSRRRRFHGAMNRLPEAALRAMTAIDHRHHVALVAEAGCSDGAARLVADARYVREQGGADHTAEFAIAVADDWQGLGLGRALMRRIAAIAQSHGLVALRGSVLVENTPMLALMRRLGATLHPEPGDGSIVQVRFAL